MKQDVADYVRKCDKCQRYSALIRVHPERLMVIFCPWLFAKWRIDIIGPLPMLPGGRLLHQVGRVYSFINHHWEEPDQVHPQTHHLQVWDTLLIGFGQYSSPCHSYVPWKSSTLFSLYSNCSCSVAIGPLPRRLVLGAIDLRSINTTKLLVGRKKR